MRTLLICVIAAMAWSNAGIVAAPPAAARSFSTGNFVLEIDGNIAGVVSTAEGGLAFGEVVKVPGEDFFFKKQLGNFGYRDIRLEFGTGMDKSFLNAIALALQGQSPKFNGALLRTDHNFNVVSRLEFLRAQITEVTFPAADGASKEPFRMSVVLSPEQTSLSRGALGKAGATLAGKQKAALTSNFRLSIDGLNTTKVSKVEALTIKLPRLNFGDDEVCVNCVQFHEGTPRVDFPHVIITISEPADSVYDWFEDFVIDGNNDDSQEKSGTLEFLTGNTQAPVFTIKFNNLGIFELAAVVDAKDVARLMAAMYCESMEFVAH